MKIEERKSAVLEYLQFERDERIPELIEAHDGDVEYVINEIWGPLTTILDGKTDNVLQIGEAERSGVLLICCYALVLRGQD